MMASLFSVVANHLMISCKKVVLLSNSMSLNLSFFFINPIPQFFKVIFDFFLAINKNIIFGSTGGF